MQLGEHTSTPDRPVRSWRSTGCPSRRRGPPPSRRHLRGPRSSCSGCPCLVDPVVDDLPEAGIRPRESVDPMYMPGRLRTASSPSSTDRCRAVYPPPWRVSPRQRAAEAQPVVRTLGSPVRGFAVRAARCIGGDDDQAGARAGRIPDDRRFAHSEAGPMDSAEGFRPVFMLEPIVGPFAERSTVTTAVLPVPGRRPLRSLRRSGLHPRCPTERQ